MSRTFPSLGRCVFVGGGLSVGVCFPQSLHISDIKHVGHMKNVAEVTLKDMWPCWDQSALWVISPRPFMHRLTQRTQLVVFCFLASKSHHNPRHVFHAFLFQFQTSVAVLFPFHINNNAKWDVLCWADLNHYEWLSPQVQQISHPYVMLSSSLSAEHFNILHFLRKQCCMFSNIDMYIKS